jgi:hypothetical protein
MTYEDIMIVSPRMIIICQGFGQLADVLIQYYRAGKDRSCGQSPQHQPDSCCKTYVSVMVNNMVQFELSS